MKKIASLALGLLLLGFFCVYAQGRGSGVANNRLYDFTFVDTDFAAVFHSLSATSGVDILLAPDVTGKLSLDVTQKTWQEVLDIICAMNDLTWLVQDKYISVQRTATYQAKLLKEAEKREQSELVAPLVRKNFQIRHAKADELVKVLDNMKSSRGRISVIERNNAIIVYDTETRIDQMEKTLNELDVETLQIVITAKLVVVDSKLARELGVDWTARMGTTTLTPGTASAAGSTAGSSRASGVIKNAPGASAMDATATTITMSVLDNNMGVAIASLLGDSKSEVLASPQISTLDHTEARIFMGEKISIRVIDNEGQSSTQMVESGIKLTVTPHVAGDNRIMLDLKPENNSYGYDQKGQAVISTQEAQTKVVVADGETVVIGGLTKNEEINVETGVPFLKDIPVLGYLFKYAKKEVNKKDLVIFVTPRVMRNFLGTPQEAAASMQVEPAAPAVQAAQPVQAIQPAAPAVAAPVETAKPAEAPAAPKAASPAPSEDPNAWGDE